jgi:hypothetical protein
MDIFLSRQRQRTEEDKGEATSLRYMTYKGKRKPLLFTTGYTANGLIPHFWYLQRVVSR